jgi:hypothetical protein
MMIPYLSDLQTPKEHTRIMHIAHQLYRVERELEGVTHWSYIRFDEPLMNMDYQASILATIGIDLTDIEGDIADIKDDIVRSALTIWYAGIYRLYFDRFDEFNGAFEGLDD